jgi:cystathionine gamma-lyase
MASNFILLISDPELINQYVNENTKLIWIETPTNPTMRIVDIEAVAKISKAKNLKLVLIIPSLRRTCKTR